jgi:hypothetical protein
MVRAVSTDNDNPGFLNPGFSRLKNNACLVLTEPYGVQACGPGGYCAILRENTIRSIRNEPQIFSPPAELSACYARGRAVTGSRYQTERRYIEPPSAFIYVHPRLITIIHHSMEVCT